MEEGSGRLLQRSDEHMWELFRRTEADEEAPGAEEFGFQVASLAALEGPPAILHHHIGEKTKPPREGRAARMEEGRKRRRKNDVAEKNLYALFVEVDESHTSVSSISSVHGGSVLAAEPRLGAPHEGTCAQGGGLSERHVTDCVEAEVIQEEESVLDVPTPRIAACCVGSLANVGVGVCVKAEAMQAGESVFDVPTSTIGAWGLLASVGVVASAASIEEGGLAVVTEGCASGAVAVPGELLPPAPRSRSAKSAARKKAAKRTQWAAEQAAKS